jgi:hypothetical protein
MSVFCKCHILVLLLLALPTGRHIAPRLPVVINLRLRATHPDIWMQCLPRYLDAALAKYLEREIYIHIHKYLEKTRCYVSEEDTSLLKRYTIHP